MLFKSNARVVRKSIHFVSSLTKQKGSFLLTNCSQISLLSFEFNLYVYTDIQDQNYQHKIVELAGNITFSIFDQVWIFRP